MKIILGVCGSIACYKSFDLARGLVKQGHKVKVILSNGALKFIKPELFNYLGISEVFHSESDFLESKQGILHINLAKWADHIMIYPASANTLSKIAMGMADDLLTSLMLAKRDETICSIYPAMNTFMWTHPITKENIDLLKRIYLTKNVFIHPPSSGLLACGDEGEGKAPDIQKVIECFAAINPKMNEKSQLCLITAGATIAPIDPVRFVTNSSSGLTGYELAVHALQKGLRVVVIAGKFATSKLDSLIGLPGFDLVRVTTTSDMRVEVLKHFSKCSLYISSAAISDFEFIQSENKLKKDKAQNHLEFSNAPDILKEVVALRKENQKVVGFAAETDLSFEVLNKKWLSKPVDLLVGTLVHNGLTKEAKSDTAIGFNADNAHYKFFKNGEIIKDVKALKKDLPSLIFDLI